ncbi:MAG: hypothetical protein FAF05_05555 [Epsilonproteobacteria bacterium]|nr:hypothetical protein [Campylobacterota bacterium]
MKILLINDNPVVTKLVTLSAQKRSDELDVVDSLDAVGATDYDLVVIDDTKYEENMLQILQERISFKESLYIHARSTQDNDSFSANLTKPFLPTDLVELFVVFGNKIAQNTDVTDLDEPAQEATVEEDLDIDEEISLDGEEEFVSDDELEELDDLGDTDDPETSSESVLDSEEAQRVKDLLDETESDEIDALELPDTFDELEEEGVTDEAEDLDETLEEEVEETLQEELELPEDLEDVEDIDESQLQEEPQEEDLESQIEEAVAQLTPEELESEVDVETLLDIAEGELGLDGLTSHELKVALGEEDAQESVQEDVLDGEIQDEEQQEESQSADGVQALKKLLEALSDKDVAASMQGMKININITIGDDK